MYDKSVNDDRCRIKIIDFGLSRKLTNGEVSPDLVGTPEFTGILMFQVSCIKQCCIAFLKHYSSRDYKLRPDHHRSRFVVNWRANLYIVRSVIDFSIDISACCIF